MLATRRWLWIEAEESAVGAGGMGAESPEGVAAGAGAPPLHPQAGAAQPQPELQALLQQLDFLQQ